MKKIIITLGAPLNMNDASVGHHLLSRLEETVRQYVYGDTVIVTGARCQKLAVSEAQVMHDWLAKHQIPCLMEERALNTVQNGIFTRQIVDGLGLEDVPPIMVITSDFHLPRATLIFLHYFAGLEVYFRPAVTKVADEISSNEPLHLIRLIQYFPPPAYEDLSLIEEVKRGYIYGINKKISDLHQSDETGCRPLHWAASYGFTDICEILLKQGADINVINNAGLTPLHYAIINGRVDTVWFLLENKADLSIAGINMRWEGHCTPYQALQVLRNNHSPEVYTTLVLMINKFNPNPGIVWIRHAETEQNKAMHEKRDTTGIYDTKLTTEGYRVINEINAYVRKYNLLDGYDVFCSPLSRTLETCRVMIEGTECQPLIDHRICERLNHTSCIGQSKDILEKLYDWDFSRVPKHWWFRPEVNNYDNLTVIEEDWDTLLERIELFYQDVTKNLTKKTLVVTHGGVIYRLFNSTLIARNCDAFELSPKSLRA